MDALVMAGGKGTRLGMGEKPIVSLQGRPLIGYVVDALKGAGLRRIWVATTSNVPMTEAWAIENGLEVVSTSGVGYVADMVQAVKIAEVAGSILVVMADLPLLSGDLICEIAKVYSSRPEPALSVHTPIEIHRRLKRRPDALFNYGGRLIVPSGVNILDGSDIEEEQEDYHLIMERVELAINVNAVEDLELCQDLLGRLSGDGLYKNDSKGL